MFSQWTPLILMIALTHNCCNKQREVCLAHVLTTLTIIRVKWYSLLESAIKAPGYSLGSFSGYFWLPPQLSTTCYVLRTRRVVRVWNCSELLWWSCWWLEVVVVSWRDKYHPRLVMMCHAGSNNDITHYNASLVSMSSITHWSTMVNTKVEMMISV